MLQHAVCQTAADLQEGKTHLRGTLSVGGEGAVSPFLQSPLGILLSHSVWAQGQAGEYTCTALTALAAGTALRGACWGMRFEVVFAHSGAVRRLLPVAVPALGFQPLPRGTIRLNVVAAQLLPHRRCRPSRHGACGRTEEIGLFDVQLHVRWPLGLTPEMVSKKRVFPEISRKWKIIRVSEICPFLGDAFHSKVIYSKMMYSKVIYP